MSRRAVIIPRDENEPIQMRTWVDFRSDRKPSLRERWHTYWQKPSPAPDWWVYAFMLFIIAAAVIDVMYPLVRPFFR